MEDVILFRNEYDTSNFLSTYHISPIVINNKKYLSPEHYYQSKKFISPSIRQLVADSLTAHEAVMLGRSKIFEKTCEMSFGNKRENIMFQALYAKFSQHDHLKTQLLQTGQLLIINESSDTFWGEGRQTVGRNVLGLVLMRVRDVIRKDEQEWMLTK